MNAPAAIPAPTIQWIGDEAEPSDAFLDALVAMLANVVEKRGNHPASRSAAGDEDQAGDDQHGGTDR